MNNQPRKYLTWDEVDEIRMETIKDANKMNVSVFQLGLFMGFMAGVVVVILVRALT